MEWTQGEIIAAVMHEAGHSYQKRKFFDAVPLAASVPLLVVYIRNFISTYEMLYAPFFPNKPNSKTCYVRFIGIFVVFHSSTTDMACCLCREKMPWAAALCARVFGKNVR